MASSARSVDRSSYRDYLLRTGIASQRADDLAMLVLAAVEGARGGAAQRKARERNA